ncbi:protein S40-6-like [Rutidosis leptorrhynchoides]|uniref:protein S40-6-like n=1 Tax=Rutidosis leptorrhynchoides TaxID=125765 RepID=UPI003A9949B9
MAKGRKLATSRSELLLGSYTYSANTINVNDNEELGEDDVWSMVDNRVNRSDHDWNSRAAVESNTRRIHRNTVPRNGGTLGGLSSAFDEKMVSSPRIVHQFSQGGNSFANLRVRHVATSAPVNVPDWSKIYRVDSVESMHDSDDIFDDQDIDMDMIPPHEYLARSRESGANSVFVGVGRTLKGRDLSRVRDAVWSQTGFNG